MKHLLDTNVFGDFVRDHAGVRKRLRGSAIGDVAISAITEFEVEYGLQRAAGLSVVIERAMRDLLQAIAVLHFEREDARFAAVVRNQLAAAGTPIGPYDLLLAATALRRGLVFVTHNTREFERVPGLNLEDWRA